MLLIITPLHARQNRSVAEYWLGKLDGPQEEYLGYAPVCLDDLACSAAELAQALEASKKTVSTGYACYRRFKNDQFPAVVPICH